MGCRCSRRARSGSRSRSLSHLQSDHRRRKRWVLAAPCRRRQGRAEAAQGWAVDARGGRDLDLDPEAYRTFNLIIADESGGFWLRHAGGPRVELKPLKDGLSMIAAGEIWISIPKPIAPSI